MSNALNATDEDPHWTSGTQCWCDPVRKCAECLIEGPCPHGTDRAEIIVHKDPN